MLEILHNEMLNLFCIYLMHYLYKREMLKMKLYQVPFVLKLVQLHLQFFRHSLGYTQLQKKYRKLEFL